jgi:hypothetical protein
MSATAERIRAAGTLRRNRMPRAEIRAVLGADDPEMVRRYLELHGSASRSSWRPIDGSSTLWRAL